MLIEPAANSHSNRFITISSTGPLQSDITISIDPNMPGGRHGAGPAKVDSTFRSSFRRSLNRSPTRPMSDAIEPSRLNVGCGRDAKAGWVNLDAVELPGVDTVTDLELCRENPLPFEDDRFDEFLLSHVIEHVQNTLPLMQELHRIATPGARAVIRCPYGSSDDAFEDPTHVRQYFLNSFGYFSQPYYWRADYGYRGDWKVNKIELAVDQATHEGMAAAEILDRVQSRRNVVREMVAELEAVKPIREPRKEWQQQVNVVLTLR